MIARTSYTYFIFAGMVDIMCGQDVLDGFTGKT
jgi:hypothetical protein